MKPRSARALSQSQSASPRTAGFCITVSIFLPANHSAARIPHGMKCSAVLRSIAKLQKNGEGIFAREKRHSSATPN